MFAPKYIYPRWTDKGAFVPAQQVSGRTRTAIGQGISMYSSMPNNFVTVPQMPTGVVGLPNQPAGVYNNWWSMVNGNEAPPFIPGLYRKPIFGGAQ